MKNKKILLQILSPYGNWQHAKGMQIVDKIAAEKMTKSFSSFFKQAFSKGLPVYEGHPDDDPKNNKNPIIAGYIKKIIPLDDGIAILTAYKKSFYEKIIDKTYKALSPRWQMQALEDGTYRPVKLISAGLTNNPNIPESGTILSCKEIKKFSMHINSIFSIKENFSKLQYLTNLCLEKLSALEKKSHELLDIHSKKLIANALNDGSISMDSCKSWNEKFSQNYSNAKKQLTKLSVTIQKPSTALLIDLAKDKMQKTQLSWDECWKEIKSEYLK